MTAAVDERRRTRVLVKTGDVIADLLNYASALQTEGWAFAPTTLRQAAAKLGEQHTALRIASEQFRSYERQHRAKGTPEANEKADVNRRMADRCEAALTEATSFQARVDGWMLDCFGGEVAADELERMDRHLEEVLELLQAKGYPRDRIAALVDYTYSRPAGEPSQEVGGVVLTLAALCSAAGIDLQAAAEAELTRVNTPEMIEKIRAKQAAKPHGSALPVATTDDEVEMCFVCAEPLVEGQLVLDDVSGETGHRDCFGDDREGFVKDLDSGEPLGPDDPLPKGYVYLPPRVRDAGASA